MATRTGKDKPAIVIADETKKSFSYKMPQSTGTLVEEYAEFYEKTTGIKVTEDQVVNSTLVQYLGGDKAFQKWLAGRTTGSGAASSSGGSAAGGGSATNK